MYDSGHFNDMTCDVVSMSGSLDLLITRVAYVSSHHLAEMFYSSLEEGGSHSLITVVFRIRFPFRIRATRSSAFVTLHT